MDFNDNLINSFCVLTSKWLHSATDSFLTLMLHLLIPETVIPFLNQLLTMTLSDRSLSVCWFESE